MSARGSWIALGCAGGLAFLGGALLVLGRVASRSQDRHEREWARVFGPYEEYRTRYARAGASAAAIALEERAARLGVNLVPLSSKRERSKRTLGPLADRIHDWVAAQVQAAGGVVEPPPDDVCRFLTGHPRAIEGVVAALLENDAPRWEVDADTGHFSGPLPNLRGQRQLQDVLVAAALEAARTGRDGEAARALEASWKLRASLEERAELVARLAAMDAGRLELGALRKLGRAPDAWLERLAAWDVQRSVRAGVGAEAWRFRDRVSGFMKVTHERDRISFLPDVERGKSLARAYFEWRAGEVLDGFRAAILAMDAADGCRCDPQAIAAAGRSAIRRHNMWAAFFQERTYADAWCAATRLAIDRDLTRQILLVAKEKADGAGRWPALLRLQVPTGGCTSCAWAYRLLPSGTMSIRWSGAALPWDSPQHPGLPLAYVAAGSDAPGRE